MVDLDPPSPHFDFKSMQVQEFLDFVPPARSCQVWGEKLTQNPEWWEGIQKQWQRRLQEAIFNDPTVRISSNFNHHIMLLN